MSAEAELWSEAGKEPYYFPVMVSNCDMIPMSPQTRNACQCFLPLLFFTVKCRVFYALGTAISAPTFNRQTTLANWVFISRKSFVQRLEVGRRSLKIVLGLSSIVYRGNKQIQSNAIICIQLVLIRKRLCALSGEDHIKDNY